MFEKYLKNFILYTFSFGLLLSFFLFLFFAAFPPSAITVVIILTVFLFLVAYYSHSEILKEIEKKLKIAEDKENVLRKSLRERASGFPTLFKYIQELDEKIDNQLSNHLRYKSHPAVRSSEIVQAEAKRRREAEFTQRTTQALIEYYENIAPFLLDFKGEIVDENEDAIREYTDEEREDPVTNYLTKEEYRKLSSVERNQMALERFWKRPKSKWLLGRIYERYVGYLYEQKGYDVEYTGIFRGYEDLGRDLICTKNNEIIIIQCKNWSQFKTIYEKHIFQFFGTVFQYRDQNPRRKVRAIFYTTTNLSDLARRFAHELNIELEEKFKMPRFYPCIKCNISLADGTKIYHLPFDQQYDNTKIEISRGEFYCETAEEAEKAGFRRAYRWRGVKRD